MEVNMSRALIVDDDEDYLILVQRMLVKRDYLVYAAKNGVEAFTMYDQEKWRGRDFDFVLTDKDMPEMNGIGLMHTLRYRGYNNPILLMSGGRTNESDYEGFDGFLHKPFKKDKLYGTLDEVLKK